MAQYFSARYLGKLASSFAAQLRELAPIWNRAITNLAFGETDDRLRFVSHLHTCGKNAGAIERDAW
jgi:hypothetical protein